MKADSDINACQVRGHCELKVSMGAGWLSVLIQSRGVSCNRPLVGQSLVQKMLWPYLTLTRKQGSGTLTLSPPPNYRRFQNSKARLGTPKFAD
jgi:hypothetical protein